MQQQQQQQQQETCDDEPAPTDGYQPSYSYSGSPLMVSPLGSMKRSSHDVNATAQQLADNIFRTNSSLDTASKYKCTITSERLAQLKKVVEDAVKEHKIFTIKGGWQTLRNALLKRNWIEKFETLKPVKPCTASTNSYIEELCSNLPSRQSWESVKAHTEKCEKTIMSRLLQIHECDFYWNMRKDQSDWHHRVTQNKLMNRFGRSLFTSKEGLCLLLQQMYWHLEPGVAQVHFPRCYVLGFPDHFNNFVEDFRLTACIGMLKHFIHKMETEDEYTIQSIDGKIPFTALQFAMNRIDEYIASKKHMDIDKDFPKIWDHEWDQFLTHFYRSVHQDEQYLETKDWSLNVLHAASKVTLMEVAKFWPQFHLDGMKNIWIMKPGNKCRGRGIQLVRNIEDVAKVMSLKLKYVVQKYIEKPLTIYKTKFDIRQWFLITSVQPLTIWMYKECYLRFSSQIFNLDNFHESLHLTNHAVQCKYTNMVERDRALPDENMWSCHTFKAYLRQIGHENKWDDVISPGMRQSLIGSMLACQETMDRRPNTYELYGADFILAEDFTPWLLEINSSPDLSPSTSVTAKMCPQVLEDLIKVMVDRRKDPKSDTGLFEMIYKQNLPRAPAYLGMSLSVRGRRVFKNRSKRSGAGKGFAKDEQQKVSGDRKENSNLKAPAPIVQPCYTPKEISANMYEGPIIGDLMEEIQNSYLSYCENGIDIVPMSPQHVKLKKKIALNGKPDHRVSKSDHRGRRTTYNNKKRSSSVRRKSKGSEKINKATTTAAAAAASGDGSTKIADESSAQQQQRSAFVKPTPSAIGGVRNKFYCSDGGVANVRNRIVWESRRRLEPEDTSASILHHNRGKSILFKFSPSVNKNYPKTNDDHFSLMADAGCYLQANALRVLAFEAKQRNC